MIVQVAPPEHWIWLAERASLSVGPGFGAMEAIEDMKGAEGPPRILGMVGFDGWTPATVSMHVALEAPIALRGLLRQCFGMAFIQFDRRVVTVMVRSNNQRSKELVRHLGFREVFRGRNYWSKGVDMILFEMRRNECRFIGDNREREAREAA